MSFARVLLIAFLLTTPGSLKASDAGADPALDDAATDEAAQAGSDASPDDAGATDVTDASVDEAATEGGSSTEDNADSAADEATTSETPETTSDGAPATDDTGSQATGDSSNENCIEVTVPNILGIEECLKDSLNLCTGGKTLNEGVLLLVNCTVIGVFKNLTPLTALKSVRDILVALMKKILPPVATILEMMPMISGSNRVEDNTCREAIKMGFPSSLGACMNHTLKLCENGKTVDTSIITSLLSAVGCTLEMLLTSTPNELINTILCDIARGMAAIFGNSFGTKMLIEQLAAGTCPNS